MLNNLLLSFGLILSSATQFRLSSLPLGPGEIVLLGWIGLSVLDLLLRPKLSIPRQFWWLLGFWTIFAISMCIGNINGLALENFRDPDGGLHDIVAYVLLALMSLLLILTRSTREEMIGVVWCVVVTGQVSLVLQLASAFGLLPNGSIEPWYWHRLRGWAENPNQLALSASVLVMLSLYLSDNAENRLLRVLTWGGIALAFVVGLMTYSDSFVLMAIVVAPLIAVMKMQVTLAKPGDRLRFSFAIKGLAVMLTPLALASLAPAVPRILDRMELAAEDTMDDNNQAETRLGLWREAWSIGRRSRFLGFGPGPHLTSKEYKKPPPAKCEAHNTPLDLLTQGGALAVATLALLTIAALVMAVRAGCPSLAGMVIALAVFGSFHLIVRQPVLWICLSICMIICSVHVLRAAPTVRKRPQRAPPGTPPRVASSIADIRQGLAEGIGVVR